MNTDAHKTNDNHAAIDELSQQIRLLRTEATAHRSNTVSWWLAATAAFLGLVTFVTVVYGLIGFLTLDKIVADAKNSADAASKSANAAERYEALSADAYNRTLANEEHIDQLVVRMVAGQSQRRESVNNLIQNSAALLRIIGYESFDLSNSGRTVEGSSEEFQWTLSGDYMYQFVGACDENCTDVDLQVRDATGTLVAQDLMVDDVPIVNLHPTERTDFTIRMTMVNCSESPCEWSVEAYRRRSPPESMAEPPE